MAYGVVLHKFHCLLQTIFTNLAKKYCKDKDFTDLCWQDIITAYSSEKRHYHSLRHLRNMLVELEKVEGHIQDIEAVLFSLFYHDYIYDVHKTDNEEKSAAVAGRALEMLGVDPDRISKTVRHILATKNHSSSWDSDTNYFTDADLAILGAEENLYADYCNEIRKEYKDFPDELYHYGRKKVLKHFLEMDRIFKTDHFFEQYEKRARINLAHEYHQLGE